MAGAMSVTIFLSFVLVAITLDRPNCATQMLISAPSAEPNVACALASNSWPVTVYRERLPECIPGSTGALTLSSSKAITETTPTLSVTTTVVPASKASRTSPIVSETPDSAPTGNTGVPLESSPTTEPSQSSQTLTPSQPSNGSTTSTGFTADTSTNQTLTGTTSHDSTSSNFSSTLSPNSDFTTGNMSSSTALQSDGSHDLSRSPGLVAVLCIFCICLGLLLAVGITKFITSRGSKFERLEDVPMGKMNEESPFARYPTKQF